MTKIGIIGGGFCGIMTAVHLIEKYTEPLELVLFSEDELFSKGIAYYPYSKKQLLNVVAGRMSAYPGNPDHFLAWVCNRPEFSHLEKSLVAISFLPRYLYGEYLTWIWNDAIDKAVLKNFKISIISGMVYDLDFIEGGISLTTGDGKQISADYCILATGNQLPGNPEIRNKSAFKSKMYFQNPWKTESVADVNDNLPVFIIGNGLTMVDTVLGLLENGYKGNIYSVSNNGFNILPHRHSGLVYTKLVSELHDYISLAELVRLVNKHIKIVRKLGISAEPIIDSLRLHTQPIWRSLTDREKLVFMSRLRHLWGVARHRIPLHIHDKIQQLRIDGRLHIKSGKINDINESGDSLKVEYFDKKNLCIQNIEVSRVINCTGPETDLSKVEGIFFRHCLDKGIIVQDSLRLGIRTDIETFEVLSSDNKPQPLLFTLGSNLKGELWESTAIGELRVQAERLAGILIRRIQES
jgi:uncharacterized NAD(P)/FAD-binding protein YdhS